MKDRKPEAADLPLRSIEDWQKALEIPDWAFAAAKAVEAWGMGRQLSEAEFKAAVERAVNQKINP